MLSMPTRFTLPHIDISERRIRRDYQAPRQNRGDGSAPRIRAEHGARLQAELGAAFAGADRAKPRDDRIDQPQGVYLEVELTRKATGGELERKKSGIKPGAAQVEENQTVTVALYVPDAARPLLEKILQDYTTGPLTERARQPQQKAFVEPIEAIRQARLETFWTDDRDALPRGPHDVIWWEIWCFKGGEQQILDVAARLGARVADDHYRLSFPELTVIPVHGSRATIELMLFATAAISELRRASATPVFYTDADRQLQYDAAEGLAERIIWPGANAPAVCLFDTGVNRAHVLLEPALSPDDMTAIHPAWGVDDGDGHGTAMAGIALHGDLVPRLRDREEHRLTHRLESVKLLPPAGFPPNDPRSYGAITQAAIARPEGAREDRQRVFCMAVTNDHVSGSRPTTWSAAIDQGASGSMIGDEEDAPRRLIVVAAGNAPPEIERARILEAGDNPIEDPGQAWNALTVGGYTDKTHIAEANLRGWTPFANAGDISPHTRTSETWPQGKSPFKPDVVMEAGNRAVSPSGREVLTIDSLGVLSTGSEVDRHPLIPFCATSAAAAEGARLAARLMADHADYWPETIRALIVHGAEWTDVMRQSLDGAGGTRERYALLRRFGYGVPSYERSRASAQNYLALVAQNTIQPFKSAGGRSFHDCHFYRLPWRGVIEALGEGNAEVNLKVTLSYFIEPNPGRSASIDPQRYQSYGLRFDLRRSLEPVQQFVERVNALERDDPSDRAIVTPDDNRWRFGPNSISAGSLHCDVWTGPAADLAARDIVCIKPVMGWWRERASPAICNKQTRYALVMTLSTPDVDIDLHTPISNVVQANIDVEIPF